jgi:DNA modification methylase
MSYFQIHHGHALDVLRGMPAESVNTCVTSPPYWGLRDYKLPATIWGGDPHCDHVWNVEVIERENRRGLAIKCAEVGWHKFERGFCSECGAWKGCLGLEPTPQLYVEHMTEVFREVRRVLRNDGTLWLNLGDSYSTTKPKRGTSPWEMISAGTTNSPAIRRRD